MEGIYRFINTNVPTLGCNLRCEYCYILQHGDEHILQVKKREGLFRYPLEHMLRSLRPERLGGKCMFNISGSGETLLCPEIFELTKGLLGAGHYVALISNCTITQVLDQLIALPQTLKDRLFFKSSLHYRELKRRGLLERYADNMKRIKAAHISFSIEIVSNDAVLEELDELKAYCLDNFGALPHVLAGRSETEPGQYPKFETRLSDEDFYRAWSSFDCDLFQYQYTDYTIPHNGEFCYAGVYTGSLEMATGNFYSCPGNGKITNFFEAPDLPVQFAPVAKACPFPYCFCGFFLHVLAGVGRESYHPPVSFYQFRDRTCADGSHWLTEPIRKVFSHRCSEFHSPYGAERTLFLNALMEKRYKNLEPSDAERAALAAIVQAGCRRRGIRRLAIYGMGGLGQWLLAILQKTDLEVLGAMDQRYQTLKCPLPLYPPDQVPDGTDAVIVSVFYEYTSIVPGLRKITDVIILSVLELEDGQ